MFNAHLQSGLTSVLTICAANPFLYSGIELQRADITNYFLPGSINSKVIKKIGRFALFEVDNEWVLHAAIEDDAALLFSFKDENANYYFDNVRYFYSDEELLFLIEVVSQALNKFDNDKYIRVHCREGVNRSPALSAIISTIVQLHNKEIDPGNFSAEIFLAELRDEVIYSETSDNIKYLKRKNPHPYVNLNWKKLITVTSERIVNLFNEQRSMDLNTPDEFTQYWEQLVAIIQSKLDEIRMNNLGLVYFIEKLAMHIDSYFNRLATMTNHVLNETKLQARYIQLSSFMQRLCMPKYSSPEFTVDTADSKQPPEYDKNELRRIIQEIKQNPLFADLHAAVDKIALTKATSIINPLATSISKVFQLENKTINPVLDDNVENEDAIELNINLNL